MGRFGGHIWEVVRRILRGFPDVLGKVFGGQQNYKKPHQKLNEPLNTYYIVVYGLGDL